MRPPLLGLCATTILLASNLALALPSRQNGVADDCLPYPDWCYEISVYCPPGTRYCPRTTTSSPAMRVEMLRKVESTITKRAVETTAKGESDTSKLLDAKGTLKENAKDVESREEKPKNVESKEEKPKKESSLEYVEESKSGEASMGSALPTWSADSEISEISKALLPAEETTTPGFVLAAAPRQTSEIASQRSLRTSMEGEGIAVPTYAVKSNGTSVASLLSTPISDSEVASAVLVAEETAKSSGFMLTSAPRQTSVVSSKHAVKPSISTVVSKDSLRYRAQKQSTSSTPRILKLYSNLMANFQRTSASEVATGLISAEAAITSVLASTNALKLMPPSRNWTKEGSVLKPADDVRANGTLMGSLLPTSTLDPKNATILLLAEAPTASLIPTLESSRSLSDGGRLPEVTLMRPMSDTRNRSEPGKGVLNTSIFLNQKLNASREVDVQPVVTLARPIAGNNLSRPKKEIALNETLSMALQGQLSNTSTKVGILPPVTLEFPMSETLSLSRLNKEMALNANKTLSTVTGFESQKLNETLPAKAFLDQKLNASKEVELPSAAILTLPIGDARNLSAPAREVLNKAGFQNQKLNASKEVELPPAAILTLPVSDTRNLSALEREVLNKAVFQNKKLNASKEVELALPISNTRNLSAPVREVLNKAAFQNQKLNASKEVELALPISATRNLSAPVREVLNKGAFQNQKWNSLKEVELALPISDTRNLSASAREVLNKTVFQNQKLNASKEAELLTLPISGTRNISEPGREVLNKAVFQNHKLNASKEVELPPAAILTLPISGTRNFSVPEREVLNKSLFRDQKLNVSREIETQLAATLALPIGDTRNFSRPKKEILNEILPTKAFLDQKLNVSKEVEVLPAAILTLPISDTRNLSEPEREVLNKSVFRDQKLNVSRVIDTQPTVTLAIPIGGTRNLSRPAKAMLNETLATVFLGQKQNITAKVDIQPAVVTLSLPITDTRNLSMPEREVINEAVFRDQKLNASRQANVESAANLTVSILAANLTIPNGNVHNFTKLKNKIGLNETLSAKILQGQTLNASTEVVEPVVNLTAGSRPGVVNLTVPADDARNLPMPAKIIQGQKPNASTTEVDVQTAVTLTLPITNTRNLSMPEWAIALNKSMFQDQKLNTSTEAGVNPVVNLTFPTVNTRNLSMPEWAIALNKSMFQDQKLNTSTEAGVRPVVNLTVPITNTRNLSMPEWAIALNKSMFQHQKLNASNEAGVHPVTLPIANTQNLSMPEWAIALNKSMFQDQKLNTSTKAGVHPVVTLTHPVSDNRNFSLLSQVFQTQKPNASNEASILAAVNKTVHSASPYNISIPQMEIAVNKTIPKMGQFHRIVLNKAVVFQGQESNASVYLTVPSSSVRNISMPEKTVALNTTLPTIAVFLGQKPNASTTVNLTLPDRNHRNTSISQMAIALNRTLLPILPDFQGQGKKLNISREVSIQPAANLTALHDEKNAETEAITDTTKSQTASETQTNVQSLTNSQDLTNLQDDLTNTQNLMNLQDLANSQDLINPQNHASPQDEMNPQEINKVSNFVVDEGSRKKISSSDIALIGPNASDNQDGQKAQPNSDTPDLVKPFSLFVSTFAKNVNTSTSRLTSQICKSSALEDAHEHLSKESLAILEQTCVKADSHHQHTNWTLPYLPRKPGSKALTWTVTATSSSARSECMDHFGYFEMTIANLDESGVWEWYQQWTQTSRFGPNGANFKAYGEVKFFGQEFLNDDDYDCGLELGGCTRRPSCNTILTLYRDDMALARKVYFVMKLQNTMNQVLKTYYDTIVAAHVNAAGYVDAIINTCTQQIAAEAANTCEFIKTSVTNVMSIVTNVASGIIMGPLGLGASELSELIPQKINGQNALLYSKDKFELIFNMYTASMLAEAKAHNSMCDGLGVIETNNPGHYLVLQSALQRMSMAYRKALSSNTKELNRGKFYDDGPSALSLMISSPIWANETGVSQILTDPYQMEEIMTNEMKEGLMAAAYKMAKCFMKCTTHPQAHLFCEGFNDWEFGDAARKKYGRPGDGHKPHSKMAELETRMRICPRQNKVCQIECWSQERSGFSMPMHGFDRVQADPLKFDVKKAMYKLYEYYKENGNEDPHADWGESLMEKMKGSTAPRFWLPVCDSDQGYVHIVDWGHQGRFWSKNIDRRSFPLSCGGFRSEETKTFIKAMGLGNWDGEASFGLNPFYKVYAPKSLSGIIEAPLDSFLAFCALGIQYPQEDTQFVRIGQLRIRREESRLCEPVIEETQGMSWYIANLYFCEKSEAAKELFRIQGVSGKIIGLSTVKNHLELCRRWVSTENARFLHAEDEVGKGDQSIKGFNAGYSVADVQGGKGGSGLRPIRRSRVGKETDLKRAEEAK